VTLRLEGGEGKGLKVKSHRFCLKASQFKSSIQKPSIFFLLGKEVSVPKVVAENQSAVGLLLN